MKVIFIKELKKQGKIDEIKEVSDGYATNFLIKNGYAVKYTEGSNKRLQADIKAREEKENKEIQEANNVKNKLTKENLIFKVKTGTNGKVFGTISTKQISEELTKKGFKIDKKKIMLDTPINSLGTYNIKIALHKKVTGEINIILKEKN